jgi:hypothetical protein
MALKAPQISPVRAGNNLSAYVRFGLRDMIARNPTLLSKIT